MRSSRLAKAQQDAVDIGDGIFMSRGIANSYLVTTDRRRRADQHRHRLRGAPRSRRRFARGERRTDPRVITFTQGHPDHVGGWSQFDGPGVETIAQANHADVREYWRGLHPFYVRRIREALGSRSPRHRPSSHPPEPVLTTTFLDATPSSSAAAASSCTATPGGETDRLARRVAARRERTVFTGNLLGPLFGHVPNLYTIRGDKIRSAMTFLHSVDRVIALEPETLSTGTTSSAASTRSARRSPRSATRPATFATARSTA